jgi:hypothetical protein
MSPLHYFLFGLVSVALYNLVIGFMSKRRADKYWRLAAEERGRRMDWEAQHRDFLLAIGEERAGKEDGDA